MAAGLQVFNASGTLRLDLTKQYCKIMATQELTGSGTITASGLGCPNNKLWYFVLDYNVYGTADYPTIVRLINDGQTLQWQNLTEPITVCYGVY